jgi:hypothetical protein
MGNLRPPPQICNPATDLTEERQRIIEGFAAVLDGVISIATKLALAGGAAPVAPAEPVGLVAKASAAKALGCSIATLDRLCAEGAPVHHVGASRRFDVAELRAWLDARGRKATKAKPSDRVDVDRVLTRAGLHAVGGGR